MGIQCETEEDFARYASQLDRVNYLLEKAIEMQENDGVEFNNETWKYMLESILLRNNVAREYGEDSIPNDIQYTIDLIKSDCVDQYDSYNQKIDSINHDIKQLTAMKSSAFRDCNSISRRTVAKRALKDYTTLVETCGRDNIPTHISDYIAKAKEEYGL